MSLNVTSIEVATPPADRLAFLRSEQKRLKREEDGIRTGLIVDRENRVGSRYHAVVSDRVRSTTDWQALARKLGATEPQIAEHTTTTEYQHVDVCDLPSVPTLIEALTGPLLVLDTETTGLSPIRHRLISLGVLPGRIVGGEFVVGNSASWTFNPLQSSTEEASAIHGFTEARLSDLAPMTERDAIEIMQVLAGQTLVIHHAPFDLGFINAEFARLGLGPLDNAVIDTRLIAKLLWPRESGSQDPMVERLGVDNTERDAGIHDALGDCMILARCLPHLLRLLGERL